MTLQDHHASGKEFNAAYIAVARQLRENGYSPLPLHNKQPVIAAWPAIFCERLPSIDEVERDWSSARRGRHEMNGVGVATADGLMVIDVDDDGAVERVLSIVPQARAAPACVGQRGRKIFLRAADGRNLRERNISGASTGGAVELLAWRRQAVAPPTVHPKTGRPYYWLDEQVTLLTVPLEALPTISDADVDALRRAFGPAVNAPAIRDKPARKTLCVPATVAVAPAGAYDEPPERWWEESQNRAKIERLIRLFGVVHRAARDRGGRITVQMEGTDASGHPHRPETIDINATDHWKHVVRIIIDVLGNSQEAYWLHIEVSRGNAILGLPGGPQTYDAVGNRKFFGSVVDARTFAARSGKSARTLRSLLWWARFIEGRPQQPLRARRKAFVTAWYRALEHLQRAGVEPNIAAARQRAASTFRAGGKKLAIVSEALDFIASNGGSAWLQDIAGVAATHGVTVRAVQLALSEAERAGILVRTRGNEGAKRILVTARVLVEPTGLANDANGNCSPSLLSGERRGGEGIDVDPDGDATVESPEDVEHYDEWPDWLEDEDTPTPPPFGSVRRPQSDEGQQAFDELLAEARKGRCTEETLLLAGILPPEATGVMLQIVEQNKTGRQAGSKWLRSIAGEIGELILSEPQSWPSVLQGALNYIADRLERTKGRPTPCKWVRIFAENLGFVHERAGRLTPMARAAQSAKRRWERIQSAEVSDDDREGHSRSE